MFPKLALVKHLFPQEDYIGDVYEETTNNIKNIFENYSYDFRNKKIGLTVGSRGIKNYYSIVKAIVDQINNLGAQAVLIPSMGTHGGGNIEGQKELLRSLGISEDDLNAVFIDSIDTKMIGKNNFGLKVYCNKECLNLDFIILVF